MESVEKFKVKTLEIGGFAGALLALRLPYGKECRSIPTVLNENLGKRMDIDSEESFDLFRYSSIIQLHDKDKALISALVKRGDEHAKVLRGVMVWCEITAPRYVHQEIDTYRVGCERLSSESTMHIEGKGLSEEELIQMKENLPEGHMQKRIWVFSYQTLRRIYFQRRNHRLPQWRKFCEWIESLPFAKDFITIE